MHDVIIVGAGAAGLTAGAYLSQSRFSPVIFEKEAQCGGLVTSFTREGFTYDGGIRALDNAGILFPMLRKLDLDLALVQNRITLGVEDRVIMIDSAEDLERYQELLSALYPESVEDIRAIISSMKTITRAMSVQNGIDNPMLLDLGEDWGYFITTVLPWMVKYALAAPRIKGLDLPVKEHLEQFTANPALLDIITQHFFTATPAFFALSYFCLYPDYHYPLGGAGELTRALTDRIKRNYGAICTNTRIVGVDPVKRTVTDQAGKEYAYRQLIWAADQKALYDSIDLVALPPGPKLQAVVDRRSLLEGKAGNDSVLTLYLGVDLDPSYFSAIASEHFIYSPRREGVSAAGLAPHPEDRSRLKAWLKDFLQLTTYEISIPVLRDPSLAPKGKTGLIVSLLFDYQLCKSIQDQGWEEDFLELCREEMIRILDESIYPGIKDRVSDSFISSPLTIARRTANTGGAITGWSFTNQPLPAESQLWKIGSAVKTPIQDIWQAGQWTFSPSGLPIALLTGKLAADRVIRRLKSRPV